MEEAHEKGFICHVPHFNSLSHYLRMEWLTPILTRLIELSSLPLQPFETDFAVDATGFGLAGTRAGSTTAPSKRRQG